MRLVFLGSPQEVIQPLTLLHHDCKEHGHDLVGIVSQPARPKGRKKVLADPPVAEFAKENNVPVLQPPKASDAEFLNQIRSWQPDVMITAAYGQILTEAFLAIPTRGTINIHPSLLPKYRGATPVPQALLEGDPVTGVSILFTVKKLDAGNIIIQKEFSIEPRETAGHLTERLFKASGEMIWEALDKLNDKEFLGDSQDESQVTHCRKIAKADGLIDWHDSAQTILRKFQGYSPWPGIFSDLNGRKVSFLDVEVEVEVSDQSRENLRPGEFTFDKSIRALVVGTGADTLKVNKLQNAGGKPMEAHSFWNGIKGGQTCFTSPETNNG